jgi:hypothetical protein
VICLPEEIPYTSRALYKFYERVLTDKGPFYNLVRNELHGVSGVEIYSEEPRDSDFSCFDYNQEGWDSDADNSGENFSRFVWRNCIMTMDDDGLYWKSESGKSAALLIYGITKAELLEKRVKLWVAPKETSDQMGVVEIWYPGELE